MVTLTEFTAFPDLPAEVRLMIWERIPQPTRVVALTPPSKTWYCRVRRGMPIRGPPIEHTEETPDPGSTRNYCQCYDRRWHFCVIVQPREAAVFPPLHATRESRRVWLPRFFRPPHQRELSIPGGPANASRRCILQFRSPFIDYENDIFTMLDAWDPRIFVDGSSPAAVGNPTSVVDPFLGLDRSRIRHVGLCHNLGSFDLAVHGLDMPSLTGLRRLTILFLGPDLFREKEQKRLSSNNTPGDVNVERWPEMSSVDIQDHPCTIRDIIPARVRIDHPFFNRSRPNHTVMTSPAIRPLDRFTVFARAWLWHSENSPNYQARIANHFGLIGGAWWDFLGYLLEAPEGAECPLPLDGCGVGGHGKVEMLHWRRDMTDAKLLCMKEWVDELESLGVILKT